MTVDEAHLSPVHTGDKVEFNAVDSVESRLLPKSATNRQQSRLLPYTFNFVADTVDFVASVYRGLSQPVSSLTFCHIGAKNQTPSTLCPKK